MERLLVAADRDDLAGHAHAVGRADAVHRPIRHRIASAHGRGDGHAPADTTHLCRGAALLCRGHRADRLWRKVIPRMTTTTDEGAIRAGSDQRPDARADARLDWF